jgi:hypothetical protein
MFHQLCGTDHLCQVVIVTTWWDAVKKQIAEKREQQLTTSESLFKPMLDARARMERYNNDKTSALRVLHLLLPNSTAMEKRTNRLGPLNIQTQLLEKKMKLPITDAGSVLSDDLIREARRCFIRLTEVKENLSRTKDKKEKKWLKDELKELREERKVIRKQIKTLSRSLSFTGWLADFLGLS